MTKFVIPEVEVQNKVAERCRQLGISAVAQSLGMTWSAVAGTAIGCKVRRPLYDKIVAAVQEW